MLNRIPIILIALILAACGGESSSYDESASDTDSVDAPATTEQAADARPDPMNPAGENLQVPEGWQYRLDDPDDSIVVSADTATADIYFVNMTPGWHITMGSPRAIFYHPSSTVEGDYKASAKLHLMNPGSRNEGYGVFVGGSQLQQPEQEYLYFLLRRSGEFLVKLRQGDDTETLEGWTKHDAIVPYTDQTEGSATNKLAIRSIGEQLAFLVNDTVVHTMNSADLPKDGIFGLRMNHGINTHIEDLSVSEPDV